MVLFKLRGYCLHWFQHLRAVTSCFEVNTIVSVTVLKTRSICNILPELFLRRLKPRWLSRMSVSQTHPTCWVGPPGINGRGVRAQGGGWQCQPLLAGFQTQTSSILTAAALHWLLNTHTHTYLLKKKKKKKGKWNALQTVSRRGVKVVAWDLIRAWVLWVSWRWLKPYSLGSVLLLSRSNLVQVSMSVQLETGLTI